MREVELRLLGPVELIVDGHGRPLGPARQQTVLAALAVDAGQPVPVEVLIGRVWGEEPPGEVRSGLYSYVARLRRVLRPAGDRAGLRRSAGGYALEIDPDAVDLLRFGRLTAPAVRGEAGSDPALLDEGLSLWRGTVLAGLSGGWVDRTRQRAGQQHLDAVLAWARGQLAADRAATVVGPLGDLLAAHPFAEPVAALLIDALRRGGRTAEALDRYARVRRHLLDELGTEPGPQLRELHRALLRGDGGPVGRALRGPAAMLPADTGAFTARDDEIEQVTGIAGGVRAISGMPGVGKTALAVHLAHRLRPRFPGGQLFVDLHGHTAGRSPAAPEDVLAALLAADGVDPRQLPDGAEARSALWRQRLAGRRVLVVLDNAVDSAQVAPLLPGSADGLVLVTSRRFLGDLPADAVPVSLGVLAPAEAARMFARLAPHTGARPAEVAELVAACGFLPLAISLLARTAGRHRGWSVADLVRETRTRLLHVAPEHATVAAAFDLSYRHLPAPRQRLFRRLALHPGTGIEPRAAAALAGVEPATAAGELDALHADSLLIEVGYHRYVMHDLIRSYAGTLAAQDPAGERAAATDRLLDFYQRTAAEAGAALRRRGGAGSNSSDGAPDPDTALAWLRTERADLLACLAATGDPRRVVALTAALAELLRRDGPWSEALTLHTAAARTAQRLGDRPGHANALGDLATVHRLSGDYPAAQRGMRQALELHRQLGDRLGEAGALTGLGKALSRAADYPGAAGVVQEALLRYRDLGDRPGEAGALVELAIARGMTSDFRGAQDLLRRALELYQELDDRPGQAYAQRILGIAHGRVGDFAGARELLLGALERYRRLGGRLGEALTLTDLGRAATGLGEHGEAARVLRDALARHRETDHRVGQSTALLYLGGALRGSGDLPGAAAALREALELNRAIRNRSGEAMVLNELGAVHRLGGDVDRAVAAHHQALRLARGVPSPWDEAQSLAGFGRCAIARGRSGEAAARLGEALGILRRIGAAEAAEVAAELGALA